MACSNYSDSLLLNYLLLLSALQAICYTAARIIFLSIDLDGIVKALLLYYLLLKSIQNNTKNEYIGRKTQLQWNKNMVTTPNYKIWCRFAKYCENL